MTKKKHKKPYFPNNWEAYQRCPSEWFEALTFEQFMDWKVEGWELPSSICAIIREEDAETGKIKEYVYRQTHAAKKRAKKIMDKGGVFTVCNGEEIHHLKPIEIEEEYDDPLA